MVMEEWQAEEPITMIQIPCDKDGNPKEYVVGRNCSRIEKIQKSGMYSNIAYVRVWDGVRVEAEFCQHSLSGVYF